MCTLLLSAVVAPRQPEAGTLDGSPGCVSSCLWEGSIEKGYSSLLLNEGLLKGKGHGKPPLLSSSEQRLMKIEVVLT